MPPSRLQPCSTDTTRQHARDSSDDLHDTVAVDCDVRTFDTSIAERLLTNHGRDPVRRPKRRLNLTLKSGGPSIPAPS